MSEYVRMICPSNIHYSDFFFEDLLQPDLSIDWEQEQSFTWIVAKNT